MTSQMRSSVGGKVSSRRGFTLVELVVVVLIIGIIAAIALPRMVASTATAKGNSAKQSLATVRGAIEMYRAENNSYPPDSATLATVLKTYIKGPFPALPMGTNAGSAAVAVGQEPPAVITGGAGWAYNASTGDFYANDAAALTW